MAVRITCINKAGGDHENPYVAISHLGWVNDAGKSGRSTREQMYTFVTEQGGHAYVQSGNSKAKVIGAISPRGTRFVKRKLTPSSTTTSSSCSSVCRPAQ